MSPELAIMRCPTSAYRRLAADCPRIGRFRALLRPAFAALVAGAAISIAATGRAPVALVVSTTVCWTFAIAWQLVALAAAGAARDGRLTFPQRVELLFTGHAPWSLWLLIAAAWSRVFAESTDLYLLLSTAAIPAGWTPFIVYGYCKGALGLPSKAAFWRMALHQSIVVIFVLGYFAWAVALWPRILSPV